MFGELAAFDPQDITCNLGRGLTALRKPAMTYDAIHVGNNDLMLIAKRGRSPLTRLNEPSRRGVICA